MRCIIPQFSYDIGLCFSGLDQSVNRIKFFSCIVQNIKENQFPIDWVIENPKGISYGIDTPRGDRDKSYLLEGFKFFMQSYLVRDVIESFAVSLDQFYLLLLVDGKVSKGQYLVDMLSEEETKDYNRFQQLGLTRKKGGKIERLEKRFNLKLSQQNKEIISSLKDIRNCFSHSNGIVRETDGEIIDVTTRRFTWKSLHIWGENEDTGEKHTAISGEIIPAGLAVKAKIDKNIKDFQVSDILSFSAAETYEIGTTLQLVVKEYMDVFSKR